MGGVGEDLPPRCYFSVLQTAELYPCSPLLSCLSAISSPPFMGKYFGLSFDFSFQNVFQKVCQLPRGSQESQRGEKWRKQFSILAILSALEISGILSTLKISVTLINLIIFAALVNLGHSNLWPNCSRHFDPPNQQILGRFLDRTRSKPAYSKPRLDRQAKIQFWGVFNVSLRVCGAQLGWIGGEDKMLQTDRRNCPSLVQKASLMRGRNWLYVVWVEISFFYFLPFLFSKLLSAMVFCSKKSPCFLTKHPFLRELGNFYF